MSPHDYGWAAWNHTKLIPTPEWAKMLRHHITQIIRAVQLSPHSFSKFPLSNFSIGLVIEKESQKLAPLSLMSIHLIQVGENIRHSRDLNV